MYCLLTWKVRYWESYKLCFFWKVKVAHCPISFFLRQKTSQQNRKAREEKLHLGTEIISVADTWKSVPCLRCLNPPHGQTSPPSPSQGTPVRLCSAFQACWSPLASLPGLLMAVLSQRRPLPGCKTSPSPGFEGTGCSALLLPTCPQRPPLSLPPPAMLSSCPVSDLHLRLGPQLQNNNTNCWSSPDNKILEGFPLPHKRSTRLQKEHAWVQRLEDSLSVFGLHWGPHGWQ